MQATQQKANQNNLLEKVFKLSEHGTNVKTEIIAGITTFMTMAYILAVNSNMLAEAGMDAGAVFVATALSATISCFVMAFLSNYPIALAPGMGLNAFFAYTVVLQMGYTWQMALLGVFIEGVLFIILTVTSLREQIINCIPKDLKNAVTAGVGLFIASVGMTNAGIINTANGTLALSSLHEMCIRDRSILVIIVSVVIYSNSRKKLKLWNQSDEQEEMIDNIEEKLSYVLLFTSVNLILGFFFFGAGMALLSEDSYTKVILFLVGFIVCVVSTILIQNKVVNLEKEINPFLNGSVYDFKFSQKWLDSCDEAIKLNVYKSSFKAYKSITNTCLILWIVCVLGYNFFDFGIMPLVMVTIIWLVQTIAYCIESIKCSKNKIN